MRPARLEVHGTFRLCHPSFESQAAHHVPECASEFFRAVFLLQGSRREGERYVTDAKRAVLFAKRLPNFRYRKTTNKNCSA